MNDPIILCQSFLIEQKNLHYFAWTGGDHNPIHYDEEVAKKMKLPGVIAHGMYLYSIAFGRFENYLKKQGYRFRIKNNQCKFSGMALVGTELKMTLLEKTSESSMRKYLLHMIDCENETKLCSLNIEVELL